ncbi:hypothetical protein Tco_0626001 [Tanacetum coccineum]|uniref:Uncharacterized protein n=1 Tax=Tanacetum coccineum TaxID=301880 RepID=A0ABQ4WIE4_9ASTR
MYCSIVSTIASASSSSEYSWSESRIKSGDLNSSRLRVLKCLLNDRNSRSDVNEVVKDAEVANSMEDNSIDDLNDLNENLNNLDHDFKDIENLENAFSVQPDTIKKEKNFAQHETQKEEEVCNVHKPYIIDDTSDVSKPPVLNTSSVAHSSKCSTSFARHHKKDKKGVLLIHELNRFINVGNALGYDVSGCRKSINRMINGLIDLPIGGCYYTWMNKAGTKLNQSNDRSLMSHEKLRSIKGSIKQWHSNIKINDRNKRLEALNDLKAIDKKIDDGSANENDRENCIKLLQDIDN